MIGNKGVWAALSFMQAYLQYFSSRRNNTESDCENLPLERDEFVYNINTAKDKCSFKSIPNSLYVIPVVAFYFWDADVASHHYHFTLILYLTMQ